MEMLSTGCINFDAYDFYIKNHQNGVKEKMQKLIFAKNVYPQLLGKIDDYKKLIDPNK